jgi:hypothetical protein
MTTTETPLEVMRRISNRVSCHGFGLGRGGPSGSMTRMLPCAPAVRVRILVRVRVTIKNWILVIVADRVWVRSGTYSVDFAVIPKKT